MRAANGAITEFGFGAGFWITNAGEIVGAFGDSNNVTHGFLRDPDGPITEISVSGAGTTFSWAINQANVVTGWWLDASNASHGFVRAKDGSITKFDASGAGTGAGQRTTLEAINDAGAISGNLRGQQQRRSRLPAAAVGRIGTKTHHHGLAAPHGQLGSGAKCSASQSIRNTPAERSRLVRRLFRDRRNPRPEYICYSQGILRVARRIPAF